MFFEVHLKIKSDDDAVDQDFSKDLLEHNASHHTRQPMAVPIGSCLSTVMIVAAGTQTQLGDGGCVALTRRVVAVPLDEGLVLKACHKAQCSHELVLRDDAERDVEECNLKLGSYELQVKVVWTAVDRQRRRKMWERIGDLDVLW
nr:unnamed protein product [Digitaria exilis]